MYQNALVATDGSEIAAAVLEHVAQVVDPAGRVLIVEVIDDLAQIFTRATPAGFPMGGSGLRPEIAESIVESQRKAAEEHLATAQAAIVQSGISQVEMMILQGMPGDQIVWQAVDGEHDVVLMGTHGRSGLRRFVLGSVADHVLRNLDGIPVLLVHGRGE